MIVDSKKLVGVPVETKSGTMLGRVSSLEIDTDTGRIETIRVKAHRMLPGLLENDFMIHWSQVVELRSDLVTVQDTAIPVTHRALAHATGDARGGGVATSRPPHGEF